MEPKDFTINDLISFGQYLLSQERQNRTSEVLLGDVTHADVCNWQDNNLNEIPETAEEIEAFEKKYSEIKALVDSLPITDKMIRDSVLCKMYEKALTNICNPLDYLKSKLKEGETLNGDQVVRILDTVQFYKTIANDALENGKILLKNNDIPPLPEHLQNTDWMNEPVKYDCTDNDNRIVFGHDEIHIGTPLHSEGIIVVSRKDFNNAIMLFNLRYKSENE